MTESLVDSLFKDFKPRFSPGVDTSETATMWYEIELEEITQQILDKLSQSYSNQAIVLKNRDVGDGAYDFLVRHDFDKERFTVEAMYRKGNKVFPASKASSPLLYSTFSSEAQAFKLLKKDLEKLLECVNVNLLENDNKKWARAMARHPDLLTMKA